MDKFIEKKPQAIPCIVAGIFLLLALLDWPYGYYQLLRLVVTGAAAWIAYIAYILLPDEKQLTFFPRRE